MDLYAKANLVLEETRHLADEFMVIGDGFAREDPLAAEEQYRKAAEVADDYDQPHLRLARLYLANGRWQPAFDEFSAAFIRGAEGARFEHDYGLAALGAGRYDRAIALLQKALELEPSMVEAKIKMALAKAYKGEMREALELIDQAIEEAPGHPDAGKVKDLILRMQSARTDAAQQ
jgi:tetratricopeptide (TPR) repeat protein